MVPSKIEDVMSDFGLKRISRDELHDGVTSYAYGPTHDVDVDGLIEQIRDALQASGFLCDETRVYAEGLPNHGTFVRILVLPKGA